MRITLDGSHCENLNPATIGEAIESGCQRAHELGRVVVQIDVDDRTLDAAELGDPEVTSGTAEAVALISLEPAEVILASLELGRNAIAAADEQFALAARALQSGAADEAVTPLGEGLELWQTLDENVLRETVPAVLAEAGDEALQTAFKSLVSELETALKTIREALGAGDPAALSDSLLYEFPETTARWTGFLSRCTETLTGTGTTDGETDR